MGQGGPYPAGPWRYLWWLIRGQGGRVLLGALLGSTWMVGLALPPLLLSLAVDEGLRRRSLPAVVMWALIILAVGVGIAVVAILRHRTMTKIRIYSAQQTIRAASDHAIELGASLSRRVAAGEVAAIGAGDAWAMARSLTATGPGVGAVVAYVVIAILLFRISPLLALIILIGMPVLLLLLGPFLNRFRVHGAAYRSAQGALSARVVDIVSGLRVLNTLGGKSFFADRWEVESDAVRRSGYRLAATQSWIQAIAVGMPALFLAVVLWITARLAAQGDMSVGDFVAVYGYVAVIVVPIASFIESAIDINHALVSAKRTVDFLAIGPDERAGDQNAVAAATLFDPASGLRVNHGEFAVVAASDRREARALLERLSGLEPSEARLGDRLVSDIETEQLRASILPLEDNDFLFAGRLHVVIFTDENDTPSARERVAFASGIDEILRGLEDGWDTVLRLRGSNFSGGQRQRLRLARALAANPPALLALDPLSAVDAITETQVVHRVRDARRGSTTVLFSDSATVLDAADVVHFLDDGRVVASGPHRDLLASHPGYHVLVSRDTLNAAEEAI